MLNAKKLLNLIFWLKLLIANNLFHAFILEILIAKQCVKRHQNAC